MRMLRSCMIGAENVDAANHTCRRFATRDWVSLHAPGTGVPGYCMSSLRDWDGISSSLLDGGNHTCRRFPTGDGISLLLDWGNASLLLATHAA